MFTLYIIFFALCTLKYHPKNYLCSVKNYYFLVTNNAALSLTTPLHYLTFNPVIFIVLKFPVHCL